MPINLFTADVAKILSDRVDELKATDKPLWGTMTADQMLWHCNQFMAYIKKEVVVEDRSNWLMRIVFKPMGLSNMPFPKGKAGTVPEFKAGKQHDFENERNKLKAYIHWMLEEQHQKNWPPHPFFGPFNAENWARMAYKHTDHHLRQFGV